MKDRAAPEDRSAAAQSSKSDWRQRANSAVDALVYGLSVYAVPLAIGVVTVVALAFWDRQFPATGGVPLELRVLEQDGEPLAPAQAAEMLRHLPAVSYRDTKLSEAPFWFRFIVKRQGAGEAVLLEMPSRHAREMSCWRGTELHPLGVGNRAGSSGTLRTVKSGFVVDVGSVERDTPILCRAEFSGPARLSMLQWGADGFLVSTHQYHRNSGLLEGGLVALSVFALLTAIVTREWLYVIFAAWLMASLRMGALSAGWDTQWFEHDIPPDWLFGMRKFTLASYYVLTYTLLSRLFREDLIRIGYYPLLRVAEWLGVGLVLLAPVLPYATFLPVIWVVSAFGIAVIVFLLGNILWTTGSSVAIWYSVSLAIVLFSALVEIVAAALGVKGLLTVINSVTAALPSSMTAALAIAAKLREERQERVKAQETLRSTYEAIPIGLFTLAPDGAFLQANPALTQMIGADPESGRRQYWVDFFEQGSWERLQSAVRAGSAQELDVRGGADSAGKSKWFHVKAALTHDKIDGSLQDVTEEYEATQRLRYLAENDSVTGVLNRRGLEQKLEAALASLSGGRSLALAYLDLDRFKLINELFGHVAGDEVLKEVCSRVRTVLGGRQLFGRIGGDEFLIVFPDTPVHLASGICRAVVDTVGRTPYQIGTKAFRVKGSIGLVEVPAGSRMKDAISLADSACRSAKSGQHAGLVVRERDEAALSERERELRLIEHLGAGVAPQGLFLLMQPIMSIRMPFDSHNFEVLLRMREHDGSVTTAGAVIAAAEANGSAAVIDRWVLANTLAWLESNHERLPATKFVCVNLSGGSLNDITFTRDAFSMLAQHPRAAERLCIEITESVALHDLEHTRSFVERVRSYGAKIALDDFGAGYTSFSYLKELPAEVLKIDGSFVRGVQAHPSNLAIIEAIVELARNLGMRTIAEWAEDRETLEALAVVGVDYVQGYVIGRPQRPEDILRAQSAGGFIEDEAVAQFVRNTLASGSYIAQRGERGRRDLH